MRLIDLCAKCQPYLIIGAIVLSSIAISIKSIDGKVSLILGDYPLLIFIMGVISLILLALYIRGNQRSIEALTYAIKAQSQDVDEQATLLEQLTDRQKQVYDLILAGRSNKQIMSALFIEQSTLKSHINQIYKKLDIQNRRQLKSTFQGKE